VITAGGASVWRLVARRVVNTARRCGRRVSLGGAGGQGRPNKARLVQAWIEIHREELLANWQLAVNGEEVFRIDPLK